MQITWPTPSRPEFLDQRELILRAKQRDSAAWSSIYSEHYDAIYRYVFGRLGRKEESEDLASQVFLEALQNIDSFRDMGKPLVAWLFGIARNLANGSARRTKRVGHSESLVDHVDDDNIALADGLNPESLDLIAGLDGLTRDQREALVLRFYAGLSAREVAHVLGKTEQAVYALHVRALASLRRLIGDESAERKESAA
jgi:RNA polymerase sigma-70 factor (ECF subfamily)